MNYLKDIFIFCLGYKEAFSMFDRKCKGKIATRHLGSLMRNLGRNPVEQEISDIIDDCTARSKLTDHLL